MKDVWATVAPNAETVERAPRRTVEPRSLRARSVAEHALASLHSFATQTDQGPIPVVTLGETIGKGGMGLVRIGEQAALGRRVAVKTVREDRRDDEAILKLLREGWVTGFLEHPNIVPVYDIGRAEDGLPLVLLKRIEGEHWGTLMMNAERVRHRFGAQDLLEWNLRILSQVCNAMHFAHSRGIVHRDLKPENIMIGEFGEVYVLDWGIAVSLHDDGSGRIPLAQDAREMAGTPCYMAPEMLGGATAEITARSDVYLLGSILYELVTGEPPHLGKTLQEIVGSILASPPQLPKEAPSELVRIVARAMDLDANARFESAAQLRIALDGFLQHRGSRRLAQESERRLAQLLLLIADDQAPKTPERDIELHNLFAECRFGFREALSLWRENEAAYVGLQKAVQAMAEHELRTGDPKSAAAILGAGENMPEALRERVRIALAEKEASERAVEAIRRDMDKTTGRGTRTALGVTLASLWTLVPLSVHFIQDELPEKHEHLVILPLVLLAVALPFGVLGGESLWKTALNRAMVRAVVFTFIAQAAMSVGMAAVSVSPEVSTVFHPFLWFVVATMMALTVERWFTVASLGFLATFVVSAWRPDLRYLAMTGGNFILILNLVAIWLPNRPKAAPS